MNVHPLFLRLYIFCSRLIWVICAGSDSASDSKQEQRYVVIDRRGNVEAAVLRQVCTFFFLFSFFFFSTFHSPVFPGRGRT